MTEIQNLYLTYELPELLQVFPEYDSPKKYDILFRKIFDTYGSIRTRTIINNSLVCDLNICEHYHMGIPIFIDKLVDKIKTLHNITIISSVRIINNYINISLTIKDYDAIDFLNNIYNGSDARYRNDKLYEKYISWIAVDSIWNIPTCKFLKSEENAVVPIKKRVSDVGYDLTIIKLHKQLGSKTFMYDTGLIVAPDFGYYTKIVPRSSLVKSGYILSNSIGIIDGSFRGSLKVVLTKVDDSFPDLTLPFCCVQLIIDKHVHYTMNEVKTIEELGTTSRGDGGFGSTNKLE